MCTHHTKCIFSTLHLFMKKIFLFLGLFICSFSAFSQTKNFTISWENETSSTNFATTVGSTKNSGKAKVAKKVAASDKLKITLTKELVRFDDIWEDLSLIHI